MKRTLALALIISLLITAVPASATEYVGDGTGDCVVTAVIGSSYSVSIPATLTLNKVVDSQDSNFGKYVGTYTVGAKGNLASGNKVTITPTPSVTMSATGKANVSATVTQAKTEWVFSELNASTYSNTTGSVVAPLTEAGNWSGTLQFTFGLSAN